MTLKPAVHSGTSLSFVMASLHITYKFPLSFLSDIADKTAMCISVNVKSSRHVYLCRNSVYKKNLKTANVNPFYGLKFVMV